jgi:hypothetical protein
VLFDGVDASGNHNLWVTNGTVAGTHELSISAASAGGLNLNDLTVVSLTNPKNAAVVSPTDPTNTAVVSPTDPTNAAVVGVSADAFHFAADLGSGTNANANVTNDPVGTNSQAADLAALMTDPHLGLANTVMAYDGHETTHWDQVVQSHLHAAIVHH